MALIHNNSIYIPSNSVIGPLQTRTFNKSNTYDYIIVGNNSIVSKYSFDNIQTKKIVIHKECNISGSLNISGLKCIEIEIHNNTSFIDVNYLFTLYKTLISVKIHEKVEIYGDYIFLHCSVTNLHIGTGIKLFGNGTFNKCANLIDIVIPDGASICGNLTFADCIKVKSISIGNNVTIIGDNIFSNCTSVESISFGNNVTVVGNKMFSNCTNIESISFGDNVTINGTDNFENCKIQTITTGANFQNTDKSLCIYQRSYERVQFADIPEGTECAISMGSFTIDSLIVKTICGHYFNENSLLTWLNQNNTCPMCRHQLNYNV